MLLTCCADCDFALLVQVPVPRLSDIVARLLELVRRCPLPDASTGPAAIGCLAALLNKLPPGAQQQQQQLQESLIGGAVSRDFLQGAADSKADTALRLQFLSAFATVGGFNHPVFHPSTPLFPYHSPSSVLLLAFYCVCLVLQCLKALALRVHPAVPSLAEGLCGLLVLGESQGDTEVSMR